MTFVGRGPQAAPGWPGVSVQLALALLVVLITGAAVVSYTRMVTEAARRQMQNTADLAGFFLTGANTGVADVLKSVLEPATFVPPCNNPPRPSPRTRCGTA